MMGSGIRLVRRLVLVAGNSQIILMLLVLIRFMLLLRGRGSDEDK